VPGPRRRGVARYFPSPQQEAPCAPPLLSSRSPRASWTAAETGRRATRPGSRSRPTTLRSTRIAATGTSARGGHVRPGQNRPGPARRWRVVGAVGGGRLAHNAVNRMGVEAQVAGVRVHRDQRQRTVPGRCNGILAENHAAHRGPRYMRGTRCAGLQLPELEQRQSPDTGLEPRPYGSAWPHSSLVRLRVQSVPTGGLVDPGGSLNRCAPRSGARCGCRVLRRAGPVPRGVRFLHRRGRRRSGGTTGSCPVVGPDLPFELGG